MAPTTSAEDYQRKGADYAAAWEIVARGCDVPPSLELFEHELAAARRARPTLTVAGMARRLSESYHRVQGFFDEEG